MAMRPLDGSSDKSGLQSPGNAGHFSAGHPLACQAFTRLAQVWLRIRDDGCPARARLAQPGWRSAIRSIVERRGMRDDAGLGPTAWDVAKNLLVAVAPRLSSLAAGGVSWPPPACFSGAGL